MEMLIAILIFLIIVMVVAYVYNQWVAPAIPPPFRLPVQALLAIIALYYLLSRILHLF